MAGDRVIRLSGDVTYVMEPGDPERSLALQQILRVAAAGAGAAPEDRVPEEILRTVEAVFADGTLDDVALRVAWLAYMGAIVAAVYARGSLDFQTGLVELEHAIEAAGVPDP